MILALGMALDALLGEPKWLWARAPHPAVLMGRLIAAADARLNRGAARKAKGIALMVALVLMAGGLGAALAALPTALPELVCLAILLAQRSLVDHVAAVATALAQSPEAARRAVAQIVGRDTAEMEPPQIARAAIESAAENLSDGIIAPVFWFAIAGLPGLLIYKITNTADSMIGYRTPRHADFGWAAARFDDLINLAPARLTALLLWLPWRRGGWREISGDAALHRSPNAGWPEAAMARHLGIALAGPRSYEGQMQAFPWVNGPGDKNATEAHIRAAVRALWMAWALAIFGALVVAFCAALWPI